MNRLEKKIFDAIERVDKYDYTLRSDKEEIAKQVASIALELAEKAFYAGHETGYAGATADKSYFDNWDQFKQEVL
jgi:hypothetical protein